MVHDSCDRFCEATGVPLDVLEVLGGHCTHWP